MNMKKIFGTIFVSLALVINTVYAHEEELFFPVEIKNGSNLSIIECVLLHTRTVQKSGE